MASSVYSRSLERHRNGRIQNGREDRSPSLPLVERQEPMLAVRCSRRAGIQHTLASHCVSFELIPGHRHSSGFPSNISKTLQRCHQRVPTTQFSSARNVPLDSQELLVVIAGDLVLRRLRDTDDDGDHGLRCPMPSSQTAPSSIQRRRCCHQ